MKTKSEPVEFESNSIECVDGPNASNTMEFSLNVFIEFSVTKNICYKKAFQ